MTTVRWLICAALFTGLTAPALAQDAADTSPVDAAPAAKKPKPKMICTSERETGSFVKVQKTCMTQEEIDRRQQETERNLGRQERSSAITGN